MNDIPAAYGHQKKTTDFIVANPQCMITSDPGTGKTRACLDAHAILGGKTLVLAPLSILEAAWVEDINKFQPNILPLFFLIYKFEYLTNYVYTKLIFSLIYFLQF